MQVSNDGQIPCTDIEQAHTGAAAPPVSQGASQQAAPAADHAKRETVEQYKGPSQGGDNRWVQAVKQEKAQTEDRGVAYLEHADAHGRQADQAKASHDEKASAAWSAGHHFEAIKQKAMGFASYASHTAAQVGDTAAAAAESVGAGLDDVMMGDKRAVQKVAFGAAVIAAIPTGGASFSLVGAAGSMMTAYSVTNGMGEMARARNGKELAVAGVVTGLDMAAPAIAKGAGVLAGKALAQMPLVQVGIKMAASSAGEVVGLGAMAASEKVAASVGAPAIAKVGVSLASKVASWALDDSVHFAAHAAGDAAKDVIVDKAKEFAREQLVDTE